MNPINIYLSWVVPAIMGMLQQADTLAHHYPGEIEAVAASLRARNRQPLRTLYRGVLLEPHEAAGGVIYTRPGGEMSVSFSESRDVACYFGLPETIVSGEVVRMRSNVEGYLIDTVPKRADILWHYKWNPVVYNGMTVDIRQAARMHPMTAHDPSQFDFNLATQKEVVLKPFPAHVPFLLTPIGDTCPDADSLNARFTPPHFQGFEAFEGVTEAQVEHALFHLGVDLSRERFGMEQVMQGANVETEHTPESTVATQIAVDHLRERPDYYDRLSEAGL